MAEQARALIVATEHGVILEAMGDVAAVCGWAPEDLIGQRIVTALVPEELRERHLAGMARFRDSAHSPRGARTLAVAACGPDKQQRPVLLTVFGYEHYSRLVYGMLQAADPAAHAGFVVAARDARPRRYFYALAAALVPALMIYGILTHHALTLWLAMIMAVCAAGSAAARVD